MLQLPVPLEQQAEQFETWRRRYREVHRAEPPPPVLLDFAYCHEDPAIAEATMRRHLGKFYNAMVDHYEFDGKHFGRTHSYTSYQDGADMLRTVGRKAAFEGFYALRLKGTPDDMTAAIEARRRAFGEYQQMVLCSFGGMSFSEVRASLRLMGEKVFPRFRHASDEVHRRASLMRRRSGRSPHRSCSASLGRFAGPFADTVTRSNWLERTSLDPCNDCRGDWWSEGEPEVPERLEIGEGSLGIAAQSK